MKAEEEKDNEEEENKRNGRRMGGPKEERDLEGHEKERKKVGEEGKLCERSKPWRI
jgi:hypothetical protein